MAEGGQKEWEMVRGGRRCGGPLHDEMAQGRGGEELAVHHAAADATSSDKGRNRGNGRGGKGGQPY